MKNRMLLAAAGGLLATSLAVPAPAHAGFFCSLAKSREYLATERFWSWCDANSGSGSCVVKGEGQRLWNAAQKAAAARRAAC